MRFCSLKVQNMALKIDLVNRSRVVYYSRTYGVCPQLQGMTNLVKQIMS